MASIPWNVYFSGKLFDTVWFTTDCDKGYVYNSLVNHDGYPADIRVRKAG